MSSILLSNPFVTPLASTNANAAEPQTALAVAPSSGTSSSGNAGNAGGSGSNNGGFGNSSGQQAIIRLAAQAGLEPHAPNATSGSVINAQAQSLGDNPFGTNLPEVEMPDPLPTSPFLNATKVHNPFASLGSLS